MHFPSTHIYVRVALALVVLFKCIRQASDDSAMARVNNGPQTIVCASMQNLTGQEDKNANNSPQSVE